MNILIVVPSRDSSELTACALVYCLYFVARLYRKVEEQQERRS